MNSNPTTAKRPQPPTVVEIDGRRYMTIGGVERYLAELVAFAQGDVVVEERPEFRDNSLLKFRAVAQRLGTCVRTLERRIAEQRQAA